MFSGESLKNEDALVLLSGGMDSTISLFYAITAFKAVQAVSFNYGQKHAHEIETASGICARLKIALKIVDLGFLPDLVQSNLFQGRPSVNERHELNNDVPSSFVPYRNMLFLTVAAGWASTLGIKHLVTGVCETDYSGYADCRDVFIKSVQAALNLATDFRDRSPVIHTPLMWLSKAQAFKLASDLGCLDYVIKETVTCYNASSKLNDYGRGCGECPACLLRKKGYEEYKKKYG